jgi:hypothetical protein
MIRTQETNIRALLAMTWKPLMSVPKLAVKSIRIKWIRNRQRANERDTAHANAELAGFHKESARLNSELTRLERN